MYLVDELLVEDLKVVPVLVMLSLGVFSSLLSFAINDSRLEVATAIFLGGVRGLRRLSSLGLRSELIGMGTGGEFIWKELWLLSSEESSST